MDLAEKSPQTVKTVSAIQKTVQSYSGSINEMQEDQIAILSAISGLDEDSQNRNQWTEEVEVCMSNLDQTVKDTKRKLDTEVEEAAARNKAVSHTSIWAILTQCR